MLRAPVRVLLAALAGPVLLVGVVPGSAQALPGALPQVAAAGEFVGTWGAPPQPPYPTGESAAGFRDQTLRMIAHTSLGGAQVRVRLSNTFGDRPVRFDDVHVGIRQLGAALVPGTNRPVGFSGSTSVVVPKGAEVVSDPVPLAVRADQDLAVSTYVDAPTGPATWHALPRTTNYVSRSGNQAGQTGSKGLTRTTQSSFFVSGVDVAAAPTAGTVVTYGDSITDGYGSTVDANHAWPDFLADRLLASRGRPLGVLNQGISGNRVLNDSQAFGTNALARLDRDVLARPGVETVLLLEGINDIGFSQIEGPETAPHTNVSAAEIIAGYQQIIRRSHDRGLRVVGGTLTPFQGAAYADAAGERKRNAVNTFIRRSGEFDAVVDFDAAVRDPAAPRQLLPRYDSGDHLHPSDAGYQAMAAAIDLSVLRAPQSDSVANAA